MSVHHRVPNPEKGARYLTLLDAALCNGSWAEIAELARKVDKHAPERKCLTLAARIEAEVAAASHRSSSASSATATSIHSLGDAITRLTDAIATAEKSCPDDALIASTCLAYVHWLQEAPTRAVEVLSHNSPSVQSVNRGPAPLGWLEVCEVKSACIKAACLEASHLHNVARETYRKGLARTPGYRTPELRKWTERFLARACMYSFKKMPSPLLADLGEAYTAFKSWGGFWQRVPAAGDQSSVEIPPRQVWGAYYELLSTILEHGLLYSPNQDVESEPLLPSNTSLSEDQRMAVKRRQRTEVQLVEQTYESLLLEETKFPKASQSNSEVEGWTDQVLANWRIFTGPNWTDSDLGDGGKSAVSRNVLDILYRAATKTFHSTSILRHLFTLHIALGEFDLAMHAFDSYLDIVDTGKSRAEKTGKHDSGVDDDDTAMLTAAEAVRLLCRYGGREQAEKANDVIKSMSKWLSQQRPLTRNAPQVNGDTEERIHQSSERSEALLRPSTLAATYRAMGISQARWANLTYESADRSTLLVEAAHNLRTAQGFDPASIDTAHALALVLSEARDVSAAVEVIRSALEGSVMLHGNTNLHEHHERERRLLSLWHLLALCLTAQEQYETAAQICEAAYRKFGSSQLLFGQPAHLTPGDAEKATEIGDSPRSIVEQMEGLEKESILEIRLTQVLLVELMEGPEVAVDLTDGVLGLYSKLFGNPEKVATAVSKRPATAASAAPHRFGGTLRSITGSIRPRSVRSRRSSTTERGTSRHASANRQRSVTSSDGAPDLRPTTNGQNLGLPIAITITNEDGSPAEKSHYRHHLPSSLHGRHHGSDGAIANSDNSSPGPSEKVASPTKASIDPASSPQQPLTEVAHNSSPDRWPPPAGHYDQLPSQDVRLPAPHPASTSTISEPHLAPINERRHSIRVLINTWITVAGLYLRVGSYDDAHNAVEHAAKLVETLEKGLSTSDGGINARRLFEKGWDSGKSVDELWADVWSAKAYLASARQQPYEAMASFEQALSFYPDHPSGITGLATLLMDIYEEKLSAEQRITSTQTTTSTANSLISEATPSPTRPNTASSTVPSRRSSLIKELLPERTGSGKDDPTPAELNRLAARDRAYMLLTNLTKLGTGWDNSDAWYGLARAHELSKEIGKAKQALWWVVELEDRRPLRPWREVTPGGYTL